jgi:hypothetical protein
MLNPMDRPPKIICGARNRQGEPCKKPPMKGRKRCLAHGGKTPKNQNAGASNGNHRHGLYTAYLTEDEAAQWDTIPIGEVDAEIRMCRVWLQRCLALEATYTAPNADGTELSEVRRSSSSEDGMSRTETVAKRPDVMARVNWILGRIAQLEKTRAELIASAQAAGEGAGDVARDLVDTLRSMKQTEFEQPAAETDDTADDE